MKKTPNIPFFSRAGDGARPGKQAIAMYLLMILLAALVVYLAAGLYSGLETSSYTIESDRLPAAFDGYRIVQLSDLHCRRFGEGQAQLVEAIRAQQPDLIVLTGDIMDREKGDLADIADLLAGITRLAPVYAVAGNHEFDNPERFAELKALYAGQGVVYLEGNAVELRRGGEGILLYAPQIHTNSLGHYWSTAPAPASSDRYTILLDHFGNDFDTIALSGYDLVLAGHVHGGIIRLPFAGGLISNEKTLFPKYDAGVYTVENSTMVLSRGLGDAALPRFYNGRELVTITLRTR